MCSATASPRLLLLLHWTRTPPPELLYVAPHCWNGLQVAPQSPSAASRQTWNSTIIEPRVNLFHWPVPSTVPWKSTGHSSLFLENFLRIRPSGGLTLSKTWYRRALHLPTLNTWWLVTTDFPTPDVTPSNARSASQLVSMAKPLQLTNHVPFFTNRFQNPLEYPWGILQLNCHFMVEASIFSGPFPIQT